MIFTERFDQQRAEAAARASELEREADILVWTLPSLVVPLNNTHRNFRNSTLQAYSEPSVVELTRLSQDRSAYTLWFLNRNSRDEICAVYRSPKELTTSTGAWVKDFQYQRYPTPYFVSDPGPAKWIAEQIADTVFSQQKGERFLASIFPQHSIEEDDTNASLTEQVLTDTNAFVVDAASYLLTAKQLFEGSRSGRRIREASSVREHLYPLYRYHEATVYGAAAVARKVNDLMSAEDRPILSLGNRYYLLSHRQSTHSFGRGGTGFTVALLNESSASEFQDRVGSFRHGSWDRDRVSRFITDEGGQEITAETLLS
jgi:hypothetical protein